MQAGGAIGRRNYSFLMSPQGQAPAEDIDWSQVFEDPTRPLIVDLGCGAGRYVLLMAHRKGPANNYLGVDIHEALLNRANGWAASRGMRPRVAYLQANAVVSAGPLLRSYPGPVGLVSVQYPDPQQRRQRHMVGRELVGQLAEVLRPGALVYLNSDFEDTAAYMRNAFERYGSHAFAVHEVHTSAATFPCSDVGSGAAGDSRASASSSSGSLTRHRDDGEGEGSRASCNAEQAVATDAGASRHLEPGSGAVRQGMEEGEEEEDLLAYRGRWHEAGWLVENPVGAPTEREVYAEKATTGRVFRVLLVRR